MRKRLLWGLKGLLVMLKLILLLKTSPLVASTVGKASTSKEFFTLLSQPGIQTIILDDDISLELEDAPIHAVNLTANLTIVAGLPWPQVASLAANYIASKIRLGPFITLTFERIILSGILRGIGQYLDLLARSDGGSVFYNLTINHRHACLPFDLFYDQLSSLPPALPEAGMTPLNVSDREFWLRNSSYCWQGFGGRRTCMAPYLEMLTYGTYNQKIDGVISNGGYNSYFVQSYGVCDKEISAECIKQKNADLCLAAALALDGGIASSDGAGAVRQESTSTTRLGIGLGVGLGGALLVLIALFGRAHWRHRREAAAAAALATGLATPSSRSKAACSTASQCVSPLDLVDDLEEGGGGAEDGIRMPTGRKLNGSVHGGVAAVGGGGGAAAVAGAAEPRLVAADEGTSGGGKGGPTAPMTGITGNSSKGASSSSRSSSSGVTIEASSGMSGLGLAGGDGGGNAGLSEVEVARLNLLANAAKGRAGRTAPLDVKVLQLLGQGSFGKVYKGIWHGTLVALKAQVLPPSLSGDARRRHMAVMEAAISSAINHPAIVQTYSYSFRPIKDTLGHTVVNKHSRKSAPIQEEPEEDGPAAGGCGKVGKEDGNGGGGGEGREEADDDDYGHELLLVLEYCDGGSLRAALDRGLFHQGRPWPWDWRRAAQAAGQAAAAAGHAGKPQPQPPLNQLPNQASPAVASPTPRPQTPSTPTSLGDTNAIANLVATMTRGSDSVPPNNTPDSRRRRRGQSTAADSSAVMPPQRLPLPPMPAGGAAGADAGVGDAVKGIAGPGCGGPGGGGPGCGGPGVGGAGVGGAGGGGTVCQSFQSAHTVNASELAPSLFPKLDTYEPDFTHGAFELILPAAPNGDDKKDADVAACGGGDGAAAAQSSRQLPFTHVAATTLDVFNTLAGAPTAAMSFVSSFSNAFCASGSAADNAAAAAAADRLAMMYLLQHAAAAVAAGADPTVSGYAVLADCINSSNQTGLNAGIGSLAQPLPATGSGSGGTGGGGGLSQSSDCTLLAPPPSVLAVAAVVAAATPPPVITPAAMARSAAASGSSPHRSHTCLLRTASSGATSAEGSAKQQPLQPAIRYGLMLAVAVDVASGLLHLHAHGVVHGDVKASNVLLKQIVVSDPLEAAGRAMDAINYGGGMATPSAGPSVLAAVASLGTGGGSGGGELQGTSSVDSAGRAPRLGLCAKVSDFGLSTLLSASNTDTHISATTAAGSLSHMSPELLLCGHVSKANDVYAYGILLFELFTGERAWEGMPRALLPARVALEGRRPVFPPHTPTAYRQLAERCWLADPAKRPTFEEIVAVLRDMRDSAAAALVSEWLPIPNPQATFLQQLSTQRRPTVALASPAAPASQRYFQAAAAAAATTADPADA